MEELILIFKAATVFAFLFMAFGVAFGIGFRMAIKSGFSLVVVRKVEANNE